MNKKEDIILQHVSNENAGAILDYLTTKQIPYRVPHIEVNRPMLEEWFQKSACLGDILSTYDAYSKKLNQIAAQIYHNFFRLK